MSGIDLKIVGQREQLLVNAGVEARRVFSRPTGQVRPADRSYEERVTGKHKPGLGATLQVGDEQRDTLRRVSRRMQHANARVTELDFIACLHRHEWHLDIGRFVEPKVGTAFPSELGPT